MARYIDAEKLTAFLCQKRCGDDRAFCGDTMVCGLVLAIKDFPTADVAEVKHGKWVDCKNSEHYKCSICNQRAPMYWDGLCYVEWVSGYCPNCGAKMEVENEQIH